MEHASVAAVARTFHLFFFALFESFLHHFLLGRSTRTATTRRRGFVVAFVLLFLPSAASFLFLLFRTARLLFGFFRSAKVEGILLARILLVLLLSFIACLESEGALINATIIFLLLRATFVFLFLLLSTFLFFFGAFFL